MHLRATALLGLIAIAPRLAAQASPPIDTSGVKLLADETFHSQSFQPIRIFLASGRRYRVQFSEPNITLQLRSYEGKQLPMIMNVNYDSDASGRTDLELRPRVDGEFEFKPVYVYAGRPVRFQLWVMLRADEVPPAAPHAEGGRIAFGLEVAAGSHGKYDNSVDSYGEAGGTATVCAAVRGLGGLSGRLWGCALGVEVEGGSSEGNFTYIFLEPRFRFLGGGGGFPLELGGALRLGAGGDADGRSGGKYGIGVYTSYQPGRANGGGLSAIATVLSQRVNASDPNESGAAAVTWSVGLGWFF